jgi:voltage-gated potassium channel
MAALASRGCCGRSSVTPRRLSELDKGERRRAYLHTSIAVGLAWIVLVGIYYLAPAGHPSDARAFVRLGISAGLFAAILAGLTRRIGRAELPELRAVEALGVVLPLFLVVFASIYLSLSHASAAAFSQRLDHTRALYFTITVFSTVGFGDITPTVDFTRTMVSIQMLLDLVIIGAVVRLLINAAKTSLTRTPGPPDQS